MKIAFLMDSDHESLGFDYGTPFFEKIAALPQLIKSNRNMKILVGDVLTFGRISEPKLLDEVYKPTAFNRLNLERVRETYNQRTVYCWAFKNIDENLAQEIHDHLSSESWYLGALDIDPTSKLKMSLFELSLIEAYRIHKGVWSIFYDMGSDEDPDICKMETLENLGFKVKREDKGARKTIFDNFYDDPNHLIRIEKLGHYIENELNWNDEAIGNLVASLEELHPYLFNILYSASKTLAYAEIKEDLSQSHLSLRRFIEHLSNFLQPPMSEGFKTNEGKDLKMDNGSFINRLCVYLEKTLNNNNNYDFSTIEKFGKNIHQLYEEACRGVHKPFANESDFDKEFERCKVCFSNIGKWLFELIEVDPESIRRPYLAYNEEIIKLFKEDT